MQQKSYFCPSCCKSLRSAEKNRWIQNADPFPGSMCKIVTDLATGESFAVSGSCVIFNRK